MGTDNVREWVGFEKIKRIETEAKQNKAWEADMAAKCSCEPMQIKSYCKKQERR